MKKEYIKPAIQLGQIHSEILLAGSNPTVNYNRGNGVQLGKENNWDDDWDD